MSRPVVRPYKKPVHIKEYPKGTCFTAGYLVTENADWRTEKPVINNESCNGCFYCYLCCPEGVIFKKENKVDIDYKFCKGCGICAKACKAKAITMNREE
ncbi:pyruvate:ferredoxin oxidoreductase, delta subunit PorD [Clostridium aceticum]|uniref:Pyruvate:ferredoxin oxidoreductase, delta subunit PorD n=1 Tax=Clostridium aceticum TaxID=84022 RepID=A0A0D8IE19_9CLOT|nr:4Fe-4S binding protein [Clostridium aceticum]AKL94061.1 pyruvate:ferredoxin oxidoreductase, delta subunit PorD [Clostridium aceticum]KJF28570.1 pyruvate ferredoxin oxidoreductase [Clostridium aceticum]